jgi:hypothetical protein
MRARESTQNSIANAPMRTATPIPLATRRSAPLVFELGPVCDADAELPVADAVPPALFEPPVVAEPVHSWFASMSPLIRQKFKGAIGLPDGEAPELLLGGAAAAMFLTADQVAAAFVDASPCLYGRKLTAPSDVS